MLTQVRWEFLLVLGQGNETLDYLGSLLWGEREREREKLIILVLLLLPGDVTWDKSRLTSHYTNTLTHASPESSHTSGLVKVSWFIGRRSTVSIIKASELHHLIENCKRLSFLRQTDAYFKQPLNLYIYTLFLTSWSGRLRLQKCIRHRSRGGGRHLRGRREKYFCVSVNLICRIN